MEENPRDDECDCPWNPALDEPVHPLDQWGEACAKAIHDVEHAHFEVRGAVAIQAARDLLDLAHRLAGGGTVMGKYTPNLGYRHHPNGDAAPEGCAMLKAGRPWGFWFVQDDDHLVLRLLVRDGSSGVWVEVGGRSVALGQYVHDGCFGPVPPPKPNGWFEDGSFPYCEQCQYRAGCRWSSYLR